MSDNFISAEEIQNDLKEIDNLGVRLSDSLSLLTQNIRYIFLKIKNCKIVGEAQDYFNLLDEIHFTLCKLVFEKQIGVPDNLRKFVSDFDNLEANLSHLFNQIKNENYKI